MPAGILSGIALPATMGFCDWRRIHCNLAEGTAMSRVERIEGDVQNLSAEELKAFASGSRVLTPPLGTSRLRWTPEWQASFARRAGAEGRRGRPLDGLCDSLRRAGFLVLLSRSAERDSKPRGSRFWSVESRPAPSLCSFQESRCVLVITRRPPLSCARR
jgi:hypothetical protein